MGGHSEKAAPMDKGGLSEAGATPHEIDPASESRDLAARQSPALDEALRLVALGYVVGQTYEMRDGRCSCGKVDCRTPGKHPVGGDSRSTTDPERVRAWWGARPDAGLFVNLERSGLVDVSSDSEETLVDFRARGLPATVSFESGSGPGHQHHLYRLPDDAPKVRWCKSGVLDLMAGGIAVLPPSISGKGAYRWLREPTEQATALPMSPGWVVNALHEHQNREYERAHIDPDEPPVRLTGAALDYWTGAKASMTPDGEIDRSLTLAAISHFLADAGASAATILAALEDRDAELGLRKYTDRADADVRYADLAVKAVAGQTTAPADPATALERFPLIDFADVRNLPRPAWLIEGLLVQNSIATLYGPSGTGKTFVAVDLAMRLALGMDWYGRPIAQGPVAYIACEDGEGVGYRVDGWCRHHKVDIETLRGVGKLVASAANLRDLSEVASLVTALNTMPQRPKLVVIDTLAWAMTGGDENSTQDVMQVMKAAKLLHETLGCTVLIVHHTRKSDEVERGSSSLRAASYTMLKLTGEETIRLEVDKQKGGAKGDPVSFRRVTVRMGGPENTVMFNTTCAIEQVRSTDPAGVDLAESESKLLGVMHASFDIDEPVSYSRLHNVVPHMKPSTFERSLKRLKGRGFIKQEAGGKPYRLTTEGANFAHMPAGSPTPGPTPTTPDPTGSEGVGVA